MTSAFLRMPLSGWGPSPALARAAAPTLERHAEGLGALAVRETARDAVPR